MTINGGDETSSTNDHVWTLSAKNVCIALRKKNHENDEHSKLILKNCGKLITRRCAKLTNVRLRPLF